MKLRSQMLLAAGLTLAVPVAGWQSVKQLYATLQQMRIEEQTRQVDTLSRDLSDSSQADFALGSGLLATSEQEWYAEKSPYPFFLDGYADDWRELSGTSYSLSDPRSSDSATVRLASHDGILNLYIQIRDDRVIYHRLPVYKPDAGEGELPDKNTLLVNGDSVELFVKSPDGQGRHGLFRAMAPGPTPGLHAMPKHITPGFAQEFDQSIALWNAVWITRSDGYQIEIQLPLPPSGSPIALSVFDVDQADERREHSWGTVPNVDSLVLTQSDPDALRLYRPSDELAAWIDDRVSAGVRLRLYDGQGRLLADSNRLNSPESDNLFENEDNTALPYPVDSLWNSLLLRVFAFFVAGDLPLLTESSDPKPALRLAESSRAALGERAQITSRYVTPENDRVLGTLMRMNIADAGGFLLYESNEEHSSAYASSQLAQLFGLLLLVSLMAGVGLLIFAMVLSLRIRRLSRQTQLAVSADGRVSGLPESDARDEIGDLSRKLSTLLSRSAAYTQYLEALSGRLSHELKTPLSVVRTSIENLDRKGLDSESLTLIDRASGGADHLGIIIKSLLESTRLEQIVQQADRQAVPLVDWFDGSLMRYRQVFPEFRIELFNEIPAMTVHASPELLQQAFDKLMDNATSFSSDKRLQLYASRNGQGAMTRVSMGVINRGEAIASDVLDQVFEPMYSSRQAGPHEGHLGLGLYVVQMIAESHGGEAFVLNEPPFVKVGMRLPVV